MFPCGRLTCLFRVQAAARYIFEERLCYGKPLVFSVQLPMAYEKMSQARHLRSGWGTTRCWSSLPLPWSAEAQVHLLRPCPRIYGFMLYKVVKLSRAVCLPSPPESAAQFLAPVATCDRTPVAVKDDHAVTPNSVKQMITSPRCPSIAGFHRT